MAVGIPAAFLPPTSPAAPSLPLPPSPRAMPQLWDSMRVGSALGTLAFGPAFGDEGRVIVEIDSSVKTDKQKSAGKSKSKTKVTGKDDIKGKLTVKWTDKSWESGCRFTMQLDPQGPNGGVPLTVDHPEFMRRTGSPTIGQTSAAQPIKIIIKKAGKMTIGNGGTMFSQDFDFEEWVPPDDTPGTTDTPSRANGYGFNANATSYGTPAPTGASAFNGAATGFGGPASPKVNP